MKPYQPSFGPDETAIAFGLWRKIARRPEGQWLAAVAGGEPEARDAFRQAAQILAGQSLCNTASPPQAAHR